MRLYEEGLVYRGHRVIHWCPRCLTSLSDEEAEPRETHGKLYYVRYDAADGSGRSITVATTRPETIPGDVAVAVNPADERYRDLVGTKVLLPLIGIEIPVIADDYVDAAFGTGALKITPAHDQNDFEVGRRHKLPTPVIIDEVGNVREVADAAGRVPRELAGLDRFEARDRIAVAAARCGLARENGGAPEQRAPLLSLRDGDRAATLGSVVCEDGRRSRRRRCRRCATARSAFSRSDGRRCT